MGRLLISGVIATACAAALAFAGPGRAQCRLCDTPITGREDPRMSSDVSLQLETALDFGRLVLTGESGGSAAIQPDGATSSQGSVAGVGTRAMVGSVFIRGEPGRSVRVELPARIVLRSLDGGQIEIDDVATDLPAVPKLDPGGTLRFRFGGRLRVDGNAEGQYRGDLPITVEYL